MQKKFYVVPELIITVLEETDVLTASVFYTDPTEGNDDNCKEWGGIFK